MTRPARLSLSLALLFVAACSDDGSGESGSTDDVDTTDTTDGSSTGTDTSTDTDTSTSTDTDTGTSTDTGTDTSTDTGTDTGAIDCDAILPAPLTFEEVFAPGTIFDGSEDIAFDGLGHMAGKNGGEVRLVDSSGATIDSWPEAGGTYGLRYRANGDLLAAKYMANQIRVVQTGATLVAMVGSVNGLYPDADDNVWFTNFAQVQRLNADDSIDPIVTGNDGNSANGVFYDADRGLLFYTNYGPGLIRSVAIDGDGNPGAIDMVASIPGAALDGLNLACGNLYVVDQSGSDLYRIHLDDQGVAVDAPELLAELPSNVANPQFGRGDGFDPESLYLAGNPGDVYRVAVGVPGASF
ncbi:MAG: hypothetical protein KC457_08475 [Myxococcales bacterium]|nr:hypothetical protein [Myxococcales bacterium]